MQPAANDVDVGKRNVSIGIASDRTIWDGDVLMGLIEMVVQAIIDFLWSVYNFPIEFSIGQLLVFCVLLFLAAKFIIKLVGTLIFTVVESIGKALVSAWQSRKK